MLYRKWRPRSFEEVAGQEHVAVTLKNALASGRVAHAYLFSGARGTGKTTTGRLMAKALNCRNRVDGEPCNRCESCRDYLDGRAMDLIEMDAASNRGIEEIRSLRDKVAYHPSSGEYKVYLIDEVHMLTEAAFNALLKTLEEPPPHVVFILATTEAHKLPATISSRCQRFDFRRAPLTSMVRNLQRICEGEGFTVEPAALELIARSATGSHRDAVNLLDQLATSYGKDLTVEHVRAGLGLIGDERAGQLARMALAGDLAGGLTLIGSVRDDGLDLRQFQREIVDELRALLMVKNGIEPAEGATQERMQDLRNAVKDIPTPTLLTALKAFGEADLKADPNSTLPLDIALAECALETGGQSGSRTTGQVAANPASNLAIRQSPPAVPPGRVRPEALEGPALPARPEALEEPQALEGPASPVHPEALEGPASPVRPEAPARPPTPVHPEALEGPETLEGPPTPVDSEALEEPQALEAPASPVHPEALEGSEALEGRNAPDSTTSPDEPAPQSVRVAGEPIGGSLEAARAQMRPLYERAKTAGFQIGALLNSGCDIIEAGESSIVIGFRHAIHADKASEKANLEALSAICSEVMGRPTSVRCVHDPDIEAWTQRQPPNRSALVRAAQEMGGRILSSEPEDPA